MFQTTFSIIALVIVVHAVAGQVVTVQQDWDQIAQETQAGAPKYVTPKPNYPSPPPATSDQARPLNQQGVKTQGKQVQYVERPSRPVYYSQQVHNAPPRSYGNSKPKHVKPNGPYKYPKVIPLNGHHRLQYYNPPPRQSQLAYSASSGKPVYVASNSPKFSLPVQTINGIRSDARPPRPPRNLTTTTTTTTTVRPLRNKRIWPKRILDKMNSTHNSNTSSSTNITLTNSTSDNTKDYETSASNVQRRYIVKTTNLTTTTTEATTRGYRRVTRVPKHKTTTKPSTNSTSYIKQNDWIPLVPVNNYPVKRWVMSNNRRSDSQVEDVTQTPAQDRRMLYLHSVGLLPLRYSSSKIAGNKKAVFFRKGKRQLKPKIYSGYSRRPLSRPRRVVYGDLRPEGSHPRVHTKIKHHHHHHHHKYIKTVEKPVKIPYKVEVPKPYPVPVEKKVPYPVEKIKWVEKKVPYPVPVEKKVPYPVHVRVPQPFPVKVVEKEYVPKPYPVVQQVPVYKEVEVKVPHPVQVTVEKRVPYPVHVQVAVPVDRPVPVPVAVEKKIHVPVPYRVFVPQPYPVETKVPYPVEVKVKEPVEVVKHVHVKVPVPHPVPVKVPVHVTVEKKVPYPVEVEKKVPVPFRVYVPQRVEVEKRVPVYIPKPYPVEKKVPVPFRVAVPVKVPYEVPIYVRQLTQLEDGYNSVSQSSLEAVVGTGLTVSDNSVTQSPHHTVTVHGNGAFTGFSDRSDATTPTPTTTSS